jgi:pyruvate dehydrogenase E2 component (dihydrolipoamide acetyltransferase)
MFDILIPELSESVSSGTVVKVSVKAGDKVSKGQTLLELETEKAVLEVPSTADGVINEVLIKPGDVVKVGQAAFRLLSGAAATPQEEQGHPEPRVSLDCQAQRPGQAKPKALDAGEGSPGSQAIPPQPVGLVGMTTPGTSAGAADVPAAPSVRHLAREIGLNISEVPGTGPNGRISIDDVKAYAKKLLTGRSAAASGAGIPTQPLPDFTKWGEITREPMSAIRKKTAEHLSYAWATVPHVTHFAKADITELEKLRKQISTDELKLTVTPFVIKVVAAALKNFPKFNASIDTARQEIVFKKYVNIGIAVDTEHGLLVPVIKAADTKSILLIFRELKELSDKARSRKLSLEEMQGGTFTVTNLGGITGGMFTPIVNAPEVAILGISRAELEPGFSNGAVCAPRLMLPLSLSYDHRLIDGADGARFIKWVSDAIQQPFLLELK